MIKIGFLVVPTTGYILFMEKTEAAEQIAVFDWIRLHKHIEPYALHIPNEGKRTYSTGKLLKRMGMKAGVSDIFIAIPRGTKHGLWIEMKVKKRLPTPAQVEFLGNMNAQGYSAHICYGADEAIKEITQYMKYGA